MLLLVMPLAGWLYRYVDAKILVIGGILLIFWSYYDLSRLSLDAGFWNLVPMLLIMGMGMPFMFVTLSTVSLTTVDRADMTDASSLYTLARRVGGNVGYALVATLVARGEQIHRAYLVRHVSVYNQNYRNYRAIVGGVLTHAGLSPPAVPLTTDALITALVNKQATMLAYNDVSRFLGILFIVALPLIFLLPKKSTAPMGKARR